MVDWRSSPGGANYGGCVMLLCCAKINISFFCARARGVLPGNLKISPSPASLYYNFHCLYVHINQSEDCLLDSDHGCCHTSHEHEIVQQVDFRSEATGACPNNCQTTITCRMYI